MSQIVECCICHEDRTVKEKQQRQRTGEEKDQVACDAVKLERSFQDGPQEIEKRGNENDHQGCENQPVTYGSSYTVFVARSEVLTDDRANSPGKRKNHRECNWCKTRDNRHSCNRSLAIVCHSARYIGLTARRCELGKNRRHRDSKIWTQVLSHLPNSRSVKPAVMPDDRNERCCGDGKTCRDARQSCTRQVEIKTEYKNWIKDRIHQSAPNQNHHRTTCITMRAKDSSSNHADQQNGQGRQDQRKIGTRKGGGLATSTQ